MLFQPLVVEFSHDPARVTKDDQRGIGLPAVDDELNLGGLVRNQIPGEGLTDMDDEAGFLRIDDLANIFVA